MKPKAKVRRSLSEDAANADGWRLTMLTSSQDLFVYLIKPLCGRFLNLVAI